MLSDTEVRFLGAYEDLVFETAFCMAFFGFLRCGEFTCKSHIFDPLTDLSIQDIQLSSDNSQFTLQLKVSKTDPLRRGVSINVVTIPDFAMRYVSRYLGHDAIRIAILVHRVSQSFDLQFVYDGSAI